MNKARRSRIDDIIAMLNQINEDITDIRDEEQEAFDNLPESIQESERGDAMTDAIDLLESAFSCIEDAVGALEEAME